MQSGHMIRQAVTIKDPATGKMKAIEIPQRFRDKIEAAPAELLRRPEKASRAV